MPLDVREKLIEQQKRLLSGLALGDVKNSDWRKKYFKDICTGLVEHRIYQGNIDRINHTIKEYFPVYCSLASFERNELLKLFVGLNTTGFETQRIQYYHQHLIRLTQQQKYPPQLLDILNLDAGYAIAGSQEESTSQELLTRLHTLNASGLDEAILLARPHYVICRLKYELLTAWSEHSNSITKIAIPTQKPFVLFYRQKQARQVLYIPFSNLKGLRFTLSMAD